jgi:hypothetical protein
VPIVFPVVADPVGAGFVGSLARPGGNATGFMSFDWRWWSLRTRARAENPPARRRPGPISAHRGELGRHGFGAEADGRITGRGVRIVARQNEVAA